MNDLDLKLQQCYQQRPHITAAATVTHIAIASRALQFNGQMLCVLNTAMRLAGRSDLKKFVDIKFGNNLACIF